MGTHLLPPLLLNPAEPGSHTAWLEWQEWLRSFPHSQVSWKQLQCQAVDVGGGGDKEMCNKGNGEGTKYRRSGDQSLTFFGVLKKKQSFIAIPTA